MSDRLLPGHKANFETIKRAVLNGDVALMACTDKETGEMVPTLCAVERDGEEFVMKPLAKLFNGNPYDELLPP